MKEDWVKKIEKRSAREMGFIPVHLVDEKIKHYKDKMKFLKEQNPHFHRENIMYLIAEKIVEILIELKGGNKE